MKNTFSFKDDAIAFLRSGIKQNDTIYTVLVNTSTGGLVKHIKAFRVVGGKIENISANISNALGYKYKDGAVIVRSYSIDSGNLLIRNLANALFGYIPPNKTDTNAEGLNHIWL